MRNGGDTPLVAVLRGAVLVGDALPRRCAVVVALSVCRDTLKFRRGAPFKVCPTNYTPKGANAP